MAIRQALQPARQWMLAAVVFVGTALCDGEASADPPAGPELVGCGPLTAYGSCEGSVLRYCQDNVVVEVDCAVAFSRMEGVTCGLVEAAWGYDCVAGDGLCATDDLTTVVPCPQDAEGRPQGCLGDEERFGCAPVSSLCDEALLPACDGDMRLDRCGVADQPIGVHCSYFDQHCSDEYAECVDDDEPTDTCLAPPSRLHIARDQQIAAFVALGCDTVRGDLRIEGGSVTSLVGLEVLTSVTGDLVVLNTTSLISLEGLHNLRSVGGELVIQRNTGLRDLYGLRSLAEAHGNVAIGFNDVLTSLAGLDRLAPVDAMLSVVENPALIRVDGLGEVATLLDVSVRGNDSLDAITGLRLLSHVDRGFAVVDNPALVGIVGLSRLETLGGSLTISNNPRLSEALSLAGIFSIGQDIVVANNPSLPTWPLVYLQSLTGNLSALGNTLMPACEVEAAATALRESGWTGNLTNNGNDEAAVCP